MKTLLITIVILSPFLVYFFSRMQMLGWKHGLKDFIKQLKKEQDGKEKK